MTSGHQLLDYQPPADLGLDVLWVDDHVVIVNKPSGLLSVPGRGEAYADCMAARVTARYPDAEIVHRLDMDTSGILLFARGKIMQSRFSELFLKRQIDKRYVALVHGLLAQPEGLVDLPLITDWPNRPRQKVDHDIGKPSQTRYQVIEVNEPAGISRVSLEPITGRSHQLRVHMQALGHAILGDPLYAPSDALKDAFESIPQQDRPKADRLMLHALHLGLQHPVTAERIEIHCPPSF